MRFFFVTAIAASLVFLAFLSPTAAQTTPALRRVSPAEVPPELMIDTRIFEQRAEILTAIERTVAFLRTDAGKQAYAELRKQGLDSRTVERSITEFAALLTSRRTPQEFEARIRSRFDLYKSVGNDGKGTVKFTGYFRPLFKASRTRSKAFPYPIFRAPRNFENWKVQPTRVALEGWDGKGGPGTLLHGHELAFVANRYDAFMIHVQGSAILEYLDGTREAVGFAAGTNYPFKGVPIDFLRRHKVAWANLGPFFAKNPGLLNEVLSRNNRFIFFSPQDHADPLGSLGVPVVDERSIAIDQGRLPPGAISIIRTALPQRSSRGGIKKSPASRFVLNLDTGSAIKGPGRVDVYMGTGEAARQSANSIYGNGQLYYLIAKDT